MLLIIVTAFIIIPCLAGWGNLLERYLGKLTVGISGNIFVGIFGICLLWTVLSFLFPLDIYIEIITIIVGILFFIKNKVYNQIKIEKAKYLHLLVISFFIIFAGSFYPFILDHFGYYVPSIKWISEYGLVKGVGNLDLILGQMSTWHIFQAGFSHFSDTYLRINSILLILYSIYVFENKRWIHLCIIPVLFLFSQSPSPDLPVMVFGMIVLDEIFRKNQNYCILFAFSCFVFSIKPTMIWLPILIFLLTIVEKKLAFRIFKLGFIIIVLFFFKNIWTFGYAVFPVPVGSLYLSWQPDQSILEQSSKIAILKTYDMQFSYEEIQKFSAFDHVKNWLFLKGIKSKIHIAFIIFLLFFGIYAFVKKKKLITLVFLSILIKSVLVLSFSAQYRFFIDVFFVTFFVFFYQFLNDKKSILVFGVLSIFFLGFLSLSNITQEYIPSFKVGKFMGKFQWKQFYKPSVYNFEKYDTYTIGNLKFNVSHAYPFNYQTPLPAISDSFVQEYIKAGIFPQMVDPNNISKGFFHKKLTHKEKVEAQKILDTIKMSYK